MFHVAVLVTPLVVVAERIAASLGRLLVEPAAGKDPPCRLDAHHGGAGAGILDRRFAFEPGLSPMINVALAGDVVRGDAVVR